MKLAMTVVGIISLFLIAERTWADDWPGWRGGNAQGVAKNWSPPDSWPSRGNGRWEVPIPGEGHSSPVVSGDSVYLTTAYPHPRSSGVTKVFGFAILGLGAVVIGLVFVADPTNASSRTRWWHSRHAISSQVSLWMISAWLIMIVLFELPHGDIRRWIITVGFASLCLVLADLLGRLRGLTSHWLGWVALGLAVSTVVGLPQKEHAFRNGILSPNTSAVWTITGLPLCLSAYWLLGRNLGRPASVVYAYPKALEFASICLLVLVTGGVLAGFVWCAFHDLTNYENMDEAVMFIGWPWLLAAGGVLFASVVARQRRPEWKVGQWLVAGAGCLLAVLVSVKLLEQLANVSSYFRYQLGSPQWQPLYSAWHHGVAVVVAVAIAASLPVWRRLALRFRLFQLLPILVAVLALGRAIAEREQDQDSLVDAIVCLDRLTGELRWTAEGMTGERPRADRRNSPATPTPAVDRGKIVGYFASNSLICVDSSGRVCWCAKDIRYKSLYGVVSSPVIADGVVLVAALNPSPAPSLFAFDLETGAVLWRRQWPGDRWPESGNNRTPLIRTTGQGKEIIVWGNQTVRGFDIRSGAEAWSLELPTLAVGDIVASPVADESCLYLSGPRETVALSFEDLAAGKDPIRWRTPQAGANCASPVLVDGKLFLVSDVGIAVCLDALTGKVLGRKRLRGVYRASPIATARWVYFTDIAGRATLVRADGSLDTLGTDEFGEEVFASPALADGRLYLRTTRSLYCLGPGMP